MADRFDRAGRGQSGMESVSSRHVNRSLREKDQAGAHRSEIALIHVQLRNGNSSALLAVVRFRWCTGRGFLLRFCLVVINSGTDEIFQSKFINLVALMEINRTPGVAFEAGIEEA